MLLLATILVPRGAGDPALLWHYTLLEGSFIMDECPICGRPSIQEPIRGTFTLEATGTTNEFVIKNILFVNAISRIEGNGTIQFKDGKQIINMQLQIKRQDTPPETLSFVNEIQDVTRAFPMLSFVVNEQTSSFVRVFSVGVDAAPLRDIWFSTTSQFTSGTRPEAEKIITPAEILSMDGRTVKKGADLGALLLLEDPFADLATDALDVGMGGEIYFSLGQPLTSTTLGTIGEGDLVTDFGRIVLHNEQLVAAFGVEGEVIDAGLDGIQQMSEDEYYFSIRSDLVSSTIGAQIFNGDILSSKGRIVKTGQQLIAALQPIDVEADAGLDAFYVWPNGEVWFSPERPFDTLMGPISPGDIVSDAGYVVFRNLNLLAPFAPMEDANNFGLDGLYIVTDVDARGVAPEITDITRQGDGMVLEWSGTGRVFQVEKGGAVNGPWSPLTAIIPERRAFDTLQGEAGFYRVRQW